MEEGQRERETQNLKQAPGSELSAQSPTRGSNPQTARSRPELKSNAQPTEPRRHPINSGLKPRSEIPYRTGVVRCLRSKATQAIQTLSLSRGLYEQAKAKGAYGEVNPGKPK